MDEVLLISLGHRPEAPVQWLLWNQQRGSASDSGCLDDAGQLSLLAERAVAHPCYVLVPQEQVLASAVQLPNGSRAALEAIPFQLEEQLCQDPELLHVAVGKPSADHRYPVSVVAKAQLAQWRDLLIAAALPVKGLFADAQALAPGDAPLLAVPQGERWLVKGVDCPGLALQQSELESWQPLLERQAPLQRLELQSADSPLQGLAQQLSLELAINLLQGEFKLRDPVRDLLQHWRLPALLGLVLLGLSLLSLGLENYRLGQLKAGLDGQVEALYREAFPAAQRIVNPRLQMERQLALLQQGQAGAPLLRALDKSVGAFQQNGTVKLTGLRYDGVSGALVLELEAPQYPELQQFNTVLTQQGLASQLGQFNSGQQGTRGQITIQGVR